MEKTITNNQKGFSLLEVMIALMIFSGMATAMIFSETMNLSISTQLSDDLTLHNLAELKMNEALIAKREFTQATKSIVDSGTFEIEGFKDFKFEIRTTQIEFPDLKQLMGQEDSTDTDQTQQTIEKVIFTKLKKNLEEMIWQVNVKVIDPETKAEYELNSWINKSNPKLDTNFNI